MNAEIRALEELRPLYQKLISKYDDDAFWYIEYPHKSFWSENFGDAEYRSGLRSLVRDHPERGILLYLHIPFCEQICYFCVCHFHITLNYQKVVHYMTYLHKELDLLRKFLDEEGLTPNIREIHLGGGSPTYLREPEFDALVDKISTFVDMKNLREFAIEIDPRRVDQERLRYYHSKGINRLSFGIQDFDPEVQKAINRVQPPELLLNLLTPDIRSLFPNGVNIDLICGLPKQTRESVRRTMETTSRIGPDKVSLTFMTYTPNRAKHQRMLTRDGPLPDIFERKMLFLESMDALSEGGYERLGYDHFAKPTDPVVKAKRERKMAWNSFGFTPGACLDIMGVGVHCYSTLGPYYYAQNTYDQKHYERQLNEGRFATFRGYRLAKDDLVRRDIIQRLRSYFSVRLDEIEEAHKIDFKTYFATELAEMRENVEDGIVEISPDRIEITEIGRQFANTICRKFDNCVRLNPVSDVNFVAPQAV